MKIWLQLMNNKLPFYHLIRKSSLENIPSPLLIMVHGYGSNEKDLFSFSRAIPDHITIISLRGDIEIQNDGYAWYNISLDFNGNKSYDIAKAQESRDKIVKSIDQCIEMYNVDKKNITLMGFSQGSMLVNAVALSFPEKVNNVISLSGAFDPNIIDILKIKSLKKLSFYVSHGTQDEILPFELSKQSLEILNQNEVNYIFEEYPIGHGVSPDNFKSMLKWMNEKINSPQ